MSAGLSVEDVVGVVSWTIATAVTGWTLVRSPRGHRGTWIVVTTACVVIVADNAFGVQDVAWMLGKVVVRALDLDVSAGGGSTKRTALVVTLFVGGCGALFTLVRVDRPFDGPRRLSIVGLVAVMAFLGARLSSQLGPSLDDPTVSTTIKAVCWALVTAGAVWSLRRLSDERPET